MNPIISIIVPVYNSQDFLDVCIASILNQTYTNFELLLINDGSKDRSGDICDKFAEKDKRIKVFHKENGGVSSARNLGLKKANGQWVVFVDSDDFVLYEYLSSFGFNESEHDLIIQGLQFYDSINKKVLKEIEYSFEVANGNNIEDVIIKNKLLHSGYPVAKAYKLSNIKKWDIYFNETISFHEDHVFVFDYLMRTESLKTLNQTNYNYRTFHNEVSLSNKKHSWENLLKSSLLMLKGYYSLKSKYNLKNSTYENEVLTFCTNPKISAIYSLYSEKNKTFLERKNVMNTIVQSKKQFKKQYYPISLQYKLIKFAIINFPFWMKDLFFRSVNLYQSRYN